MRTKFGLQPEYIKKAFKKLQIGLKKPDVEHAKKMEARRIRLQEQKDENPHLKALDSMPGPNDEEANKEFIENLKKVQKYL